MRYALLAILFIQCSFSQAVDFTALNTTETVSTVYPATFKCHVDVSLFLNTEPTHSGPVFLRISYVIGEDTLTDNLNANSHFNKVVKQLFLEEGERLTVLLRLNNREFDELENIEGSLRVVRNPDFQPVDDQGKNTFLGGVWRSSQTPLFRIAKEDSTAKTFQLKISVNDNFEFDRFYFKIKVISPSAGILMLNKEIMINERKHMSNHAKVFTIDISEIALQTPGNYYFQVMQNMKGSRVNGIERIDYNLLVQ